MEIHLMENFLAVVREENISRAAQALHMTQPALSRQMAQLEEELGTTLFVRGRHLELTEAGIRFRHRAQEIMDLVNRLDAEFSDPGELAGTISIGTGGLDAFRLLPERMADFRRQHPKVNFRLYTNSAEHIKERLDQGLLDFGLLMEPVNVIRYASVRLPYKERCGLLLRADHPLAGQTVIHREDLSTTALITPDRLYMQKELENWLGRPLSELDVFATFNIVANTVSLVESGTAAALTIEGAVRRFTGSELVFRPLEPDLSLPVVLIWKKSLPVSGAAHHFLESIRPGLLAENRKKMPKSGW